MIWNKKVVTDYCYLYMCFVINVLFLKSNGLHSFINFGAKSYLGVTRKRERGDILSLKLFFV